MDVKHHVYLHRSGYTNLQLEPCLVVIMADGNDSLWLFEEGAAISEAVKLSETELISFTLKNK